VGLVWLASVVTGIETLRRRREELEGATGGSPAAPCPAPGE